MTRPSRALLAATEPSPDEARDLLRRELLHPDYQERDVLQRVLDWLDRLWGGALGVTTASPAWAAAAAMVVLLALALALAWLLSRARGSAQARRPGPVHGGEERVGAAELRERARAAYARGDHEVAVVEAFRAVAVAQVDRGELAEAPGRTAHEVAEALATHHPALADRARVAGLVFDRVRYGRLPAGPDDAAAVLALDADLAGAVAR